VKKLLTLEEVAQFLLGIWLFSRTDFAWWWFPALILLPDLSMVGYLVNPKIGAWIYNFFHHKLLGIIVFILGYYLDNQVVTLIGIILFAHSAMDRVFGYGLKYEDAFTNTHLGKIGK
jgi:hypothetical protein